jgi:hypothetical protein
VYEQRRSFDIYYIESTDNGATWSTPFNLARANGRAYTPAVAVDANNTVHAVWIDTRWSGDVQTTYAFRASGQPWSGAAPIGPNTEDSNPDVTTMGAGGNAQAQIVFSGRNRSSNVNAAYEVYLVTSVGGRVGAARNISNDGVWSLEPAITADDSGGLYTAWDKEVDGSHDIVFSRSTDGGATWTPAQNIARRDDTAATPTLAFSAAGGVPRVHIAWWEDNNALYVLYEPAANRFGDNTERVNSQRAGKQLGIAASRVRPELAVAYQGGSAALLATKQAGDRVLATLAIDNGATTTKRELSVTFGGVRGVPTEMRYAFGRFPGDADAWQPFRANFTVRAPDNGECRHELFVQLRSSDGRVSPVLSSAVVVDDAVQALVEATNPYLSAGDAGSQTRQNVWAERVRGGDPRYTRAPFFALRIADAGECSSLKSFRVGADTNALPLSAPGFSGVVPLPGDVADGPRPVTVTVDDALGNLRAFTTTLTLDRTPPQLVTGTVAISAPVGGLATSLARLVFADLVVTDTLYPGERWGVYVANVADPRLPDEDPSLQWRAVPVVTPEASFTLDNWNVLYGLASGVNDRALAGNDIQVRVKLMDGAGNVSAQTISTTVRLAENYQVPGLYVPALVR